MARKDKKQKRNFNVLKDLKQETARGVWAVLYFVLGIFLVLAAENSAGIAGEKIYALFSYLIGSTGYFLIPLLLVLVGILYLRSSLGAFAFSRFIGSVLFFVSSLGLLNLIREKSGGIIGELISGSLLKLFDFYASFIFLAALLLISIFIIFDTSVRKEHF